MPSTASSISGSPRSRARYDDSDSDLGTGNTHYRRAAVAQSETSSPSSENNGSSYESDSSGDSFISFDAPDEQSVDLRTALRSSGRRPRPIRRRGGLRRKPRVDLDADEEPSSSPSAKSSSEGIPTLELDQDADDEDGYAPSEEEPPQTPSPDRPRRASKPPTFADACGRVDFYSPIGLRYARMSLTDIMDGKQYDTENRRRLRKERARRRRAEQANGEIIDLAGKDGEQIPEVCNGSAAGGGRSSGRTETRRNRSRRHCRKRQSTRGYVKEGARNQAESEVGRIDRIAMRNTRRRKRRERNREENAIDVDASEADNGSQNQYSALRMEPDQPVSLSDGTLSPFEPAAPPPAQPVSNRQNVRRALFTEEGTDAGVGQPQQLSNRSADSPCMDERIYSTDNQASLSPTASIAVPASSSADSNSIIQHPASDTFSQQTRNQATNDMQVSSRKNCPSPSLSLGNDRDPELPSLSQITPPRSNRFALVALNERTARRGNETGRREKRTPTRVVSKRPANFPREKAAGHHAGSAQFFSQVSQQVASLSPPETDTELNGTRLAAPGLSQARLQATGNGFPLISRGDPRYKVFQRKRAALEARLSAPRSRKLDVRETSCGQNDGNLVPENHYAMGTGNDLRRVTGALQASPLLPSAGPCTVSAPDHDMRRAENSEVAELAKQDSSDVLSGLSEGKQLNMEVKPDMVIDLCDDDGEVEEVQLVSEAHAPVPEVTEVPVLGRASSSAPTSRGHAQQPGLSKNIIHEPASAESVGGLTASGIPTFAPHSYSRHLASEFEPRGSRHQGEKRCKYDARARGNAMHQRALKEEARAAAQALKTETVFECAPSEVKEERDFMKFMAQVMGVEAEERGDESEYDRRVVFKREQGQGLVVPDDIIARRANERLSEMFRPGGNALRQLVRKSGKRFRQDHKQDSGGPRRKGGKRKRIGGGFAESKRVKTNGRNSRENMKKENVKKEKVKVEFQGPI